LPQLWTQGLDFRYKGIPWHKKPSRKLIGMLLKPIQVFFQKVLMKMNPVFGCSEIAFLDFFLM